MVLSFDHFNSITDDITLFGIGEQTIWGYLDPKKNLNVNKIFERIDVSSPLPFNLIKTRTIFLFFKYYLQK